MTHDTYENPLTSRYASKEMRTVFSEKRRIIYFRKLWIALAEAEKDLGIDISDAQISELKKYASKINFDVAAAREKEVRHDVMAHIYAYGLQAPAAAPIIHLGATSCYVTDNADILVYLDALKLTLNKLLNVADKLAAFADKYKKTATLGFTHFQAAQLTTVGKRASLWLQDLVLDIESLLHVKSVTKLRGAKGTTGTQASFLTIFGGDGNKVRELERLIAGKVGVKGIYAVSGQTYTRKYDYTLLSMLSGIAQSAYKFSNDLRLLQGIKEIEEPFEKNQIGSSAMAYKRNPMRSERMSSLARYMISLPQNAAVTASTQWFERTLDDSANRRIVMGQAFLTVDAILDLYANVVDGLVVNNKIIERHINEELPFMATETLLMQGVLAGGDRQQLHERIRIHSLESAKRVKEQGLDNDLIERIRADKSFAQIKDKIDGIMDASNFIGRAPEQVSEYLEGEVYPIIKKYYKKPVRQSEILV